MPRISRATKIETSTNGYVDAELIALDFAEQSKYGEQLEWVFAAATSNGKSTLIRLWTGVTVNDEKTYYPEDGGKPQYNKLTQVLLKIGLLDEKTLAGNKDIDLELDELIGKYFRFKLTVNKNRPALKVPDITTIELVTKSSESTDSTETTEAALDTEAKEAKASKK